MNRKVIPQRFINVTILILVGFLLGFAFAVGLYFTQQRIASQKAIETCNPVYGLQPVQEPSEVLTYLTTYDNAFLSSGYPPYSKRPVWVVAMKGKWLLVGGPVLDPTSNPEPSYWDECTIIVDVLTGEVLSTPIE